MTQRHKTKWATMTLDIKYADPDDTQATITRHDAPDSNLRRVFRAWVRGETHVRPIEPQNVVVALRLSLMRTLWELRGYLDLPYIDSIIRMTIANFKNKHQTQIKKEHWGILAEMCWTEIDHARRNEPEQETDHVDADIDDDDIDAWINSEL